MQPPEAAPAGIDPDRLGDLLVRQDGVVEVHGLHVWEISSDSPALSAHVLVVPSGDCHAVRRDLERLLWEKYSITHTTLQVDHIGSAAAVQDVAITAASMGVTDDDHCEDAHGPVHRPGPHEH
ncbi:hypothetical protein [Streptomyces sp. LS1784]|uniref:cation transporter dimerization domain-containing protein n=1 Tax=Streptomyces sp. LS1784 TaxID=2851533 RepID=UPI0027DFD26A|nr:hypothetical protein [Streptomyces sp. LS1784]